MSYKKSFKMPYDQQAEAEMRLLHTIVRYEGQPVYIQSVRMRNVKDGKSFNIQYQALDGQVFTRTYPEGDWDLSPEAPFYTHFQAYQGRAYWIYRNAARQFQQGACARNTKYQPVGSNVGYSLAGPSFFKALADRLKVQNFEEINRLRGAGWTSYALSEHVAVYWHGMDWGGGKTQIEYHGDIIGEMVKDDLGLWKFKSENESLSLNPWAIQRLEEVGIRV